MIWVSWREQRAETIIAGLIVGLLAAALLPSGLHMASVFHHDGLAACVGTHPSPACNEAVGNFTQRFESIGNLIAWLTLVPGVIGVLLATPFVLQLEHGTYRLDWTQSVSPRRWIATKLGLAVGVALAASLALIVFVTWWRGPLVRLQGRMENDVFDSVGTVPLGYTLFALGLALAIGVLWRRASAAVLIAFGAYVVVRVFFDTWLRQRLSPPTEVTWRAAGTDPPGLRHGWIISEFPSDRLGHIVRPHVTAEQLNACAGARGSMKGCLLQNWHPQFMHAVYEPASSFWSMQLLETGLFAAAGVVMIGFAAWWTDRRAA
jgi:hypothetical protein